ncbi:MAG: hypothetical protein ACI9S8_001919 [Chlamydiales bacterium]|jgi:hypothetical protein
MKEILAFRGITQYEVLNHCMDLLVEDFRSLKHHVHYINLCDPKAVKELMQRDKFSYDFAIGFNGIGLGWKEGDVSKFDLFKIPYFCYMVDDPLAHKVLREAPDNMLMTCVDRGHVNYMHRNYPQYKTEFLPHGGCPPPENTKKLCDRTIDILFSGTYMNVEEVEDEWRLTSEEVHTICKSIAEYVLGYEYYPLHQAMGIVLKSYHLHDSPLIKNLFFHMMPSVTKYIRAKRRTSLLQVLSRAGIPVNIYGKDWEKAPGMDNHILHPQLPFTEILKKMAEAKIVLNITSCFPEGTHERVFSGMLQSALVLTDDNQYFRKEGWNNKQLLTYSWLELEEVPEKVLSVLGCIDDFEAIAKEGLHLAYKEHTWKSRADSIVKILDTPTVL